MARSAAARQIYATRCENSIHIIRVCFGPHCQNGSRLRISARFVDHSLRKSYRRLIRRVQGRRKHCLKMPFNVHQIGLKTGFDRAYRPRSYCSASDEDGGSCCDVRGQLFLGGLTKDELFFFWPEGE